jgi:hypothetical protein
MAFGATPFISRPKAAPAAIVAFRITVCVSHGFVKFRYIDIFDITKLKIYRNRRNARAYVNQFG